MTVMRLVASYAKTATLNVAMVLGCHGNEDLLNHRCGGFCGNSF